jgi:hypothetical protein
MRAPRELTSDNTAMAALSPKILNLMSAVGRTGMTGGLAVQRAGEGGGERIESQNHEFAILGPAAKK